MPPAHPIIAPWCPDTTSRCPGVALDPQTLFRDAHRPSRTPECCSRSPRVSLDVQVLLQDSQWWPQACPDVILWCPGVALGVQMLPQGCPDVALDLQTSPQSAQRLAVVPRCHPRVPRCRRVPSSPTCGRGYPLSDPRCSPRPVLWFPFPCFVLQLLVPTSQPGAASCPPVLAVLARVGASQVGAALATSTGLEINAWFGWRGQGRGAWDGAGGQAPDPSCGVTPGEATTSRTTDAAVSPCATRLPPPR